MKQVDICTAETSLPTNRDRRPWTRWTYKYEVTSPSKTDALEWLQCKPPLDRKTTPTERTPLLESNEHKNQGSLTSMRTFLRLTYRLLQEIRKCTATTLGVNDDRTDETRTNLVKPSETEHTYICHSILS